LVRRYFIQLQTKILLEELLKLIGDLKTFFKHLLRKQKIFIYGCTYIVFIEIKKMRLVLTDCCHIFC